MKKKAVVFFSNAYAGIASYQAKNINYLLNKKKDIYLFDDSPILTTRELNNKNRKLLKIVNIHSIKNVFKNLKIFKKNFSFFNKKYKKIYISISNPIFIFLYLFFFLKLIKNKKNVLILTVHSGILTWSIKNIFLHFIYSFLFFLPKKIVFVSEHTKDWWKKFFYLKKILKKSKVIKHGIKINYQKKKINKKNIFNVGFVGRIEKEKDPTLFSKIALLSSIKNENFRFNLFGDGDLKKKIIQKSYRLINFYGWRSNKEEIYKNIDILLITSPVESLSFVALEAKSYGIPSVTCSKGGIREIIKNGYDGIYLDSDEPEEILNGLIKCRKNYKKFARNAFNLSKNFDENKNLNEFWKFCYDEEIK
jgi:glycosyltransferase involved in cell wall biosynthesis